MAHDLEQAVDVQGLRRTKEEHFRVSVCSILRHISSEMRYIRDGKTFSNLRGIENEITSLERLLKL